jgi:hypothetical protein
MASKRSDVVEHDVQDDYILEKAHRFHTKRLLSKRFTSLEKKVKNKIYEHYANTEEGLSVGDKKSLGIFSLKIQEQRRDNMADTKKLCYDLGFNPELYKETRNIKAISPSHDNGLFTYVQYEQQNNYLKKQDPDYAEMNDAIKEVLAKEKPEIEELENTLEVVWSFRKTLEDELEKDKDFFKEAIDEYTTKEGGFAPQTDTFFLHMNNNVSYGSYEMHLFSPKRFLSHLVQIGDEPEHPKRDYLINKGYEKMEKDIHASTADFLLINHAKEVGANVIGDIAEIKKSNAPEKAYDYILNNIEDKEIINNVESFVKDKKKDMAELNPVIYLAESVKQVSLVVKIDPPRGHKSLEAIKKATLLAEAQESVEVLETFALSAKVTSLEDIYVEHDRAEKNGERFDTRKLIAQGEFLNSKDTEVKVDNNKPKKAPLTLSLGQ